MAVLSFLLILSSATTAPLPEQPQPQPEASDAPPAAAMGLWPSPRLIELMIVRWAEEASAEYELDDDQRATVREAAVKRWTDFSSQHEQELQPLLNEFLEMRLGLEPPEKDRVKQWAERALPVFEQVRDELHKSTDDFRKVMRPEQRAKLEVEVFKHRAGLQFAENKLRHWSQGNIDPDDVWEPVGESRQERRERRRAKEAEVEAAVEAAAKAARPTDQISQELDSWAQYTEAFIAAYELNEAQRTTVLSCLKELQERATTHREAHRKEIDELEKRIEKEAKADAEQAAIKEELVRLYGPVDTMFGELKTRLAAVLTSEQRAKGEFKFPPDRNEPEDERTPSPAEKTERRQGD